MNWDEIKGNWKQLAGKAQATWGDITEDEWHKAEGRREQIVGLVQAKYGHTKEAARKEVDRWIQSL